MSERMTAWRIALWQWVFDRTVGSRRLSWWAIERLAAAETDRWIATAKRERMEAGR